MHGQAVAPRTPPGRDTRCGARAGPADMAMTVTINGEERELADLLSVAEMLRTLGAPSGRVAVEVNEEVVPRESYAERRLASGDRVEIVHFVGGG